MQGISATVTAPLSDENKASPPSVETTQPAPSLPDARGERTADISQDFGSLSAEDAVWLSQAGINTGDVRLEWSGFEHLTTKLEPGEAEPVIWSRLTCNDLDILVLIATEEEVASPVASAFPLP